MTTTDQKQNQGVTAKKVVAQNTEQASKLLSKQAETDENNEVEAVTAPKTAKVAKPKGAKVPKSPRPLSMEKLGDKLRAENATPEQIESAFVEAYKPKGVQDINFIKGRIEIYLKIADKRIAQATAVKAQTIKA